MPRKSNKKKSNKKKLNKKKLNKKIRKSKLVSCIEAMMHNTTSLTKPNVGDKVVIITKPYNLHKCYEGYVSILLTKKKFHSRGHKVLLEDNVKGRIVKIVDFYEVKNSTDFKI